MSFNPTLESNIGFTQAVEQPNAMGAIAGLLDGLGAFSKPQAAPKPTQDEQFAAAWGAFSEGQGASLNPSNPNYNSNLKQLAPAFLRQFPQFGSQVSSMLGASGVELPMDTETYRQDAEAKAAIDMQTEFKFSPRGLMADANARSYATDENGNFNQNKYNEYFNKEQAKFYTTQAEITALTEQANIAENRTKVGASYWETGKDFANTFMQTQLAGLSNLLVDVQDGTAEVTPEMATMLGIKPGQINAQNFYIALQSYRPNLARMLKDATAGELASAGADIDVLSTTNPDKAWYDEVMSPVDSLIEIAKTNFGDVDKTLKTLQSGDALITLQTIKREDPDLYARINVANAVPPELRSETFRLFTEKGDAWNKVANSLSLTFGATGETPDSTAARISDMSGTDAQAALEFSLGVAETGKAEGDNLRNATMTIFSALDRVKPNEFLGYDTFKSITKNAKGIVQEAAADPVFGNYVEKKVLADLNKNLKALTLQIQGNPNLSVVMENGQLSVVSTGGQMVTGMTGTAVDQSTVEFNAMEVQRIMESPEFIGLQNKLNDMKAFGSLGDKVSEAFAMENNLTPEQKQMSRSSVTSQLLDRFEGGGDYDALFGFANREGGPFSNVKVSKMTIGELKAFADGEYADYSRQQLGYKATPMGRFQFVGTTLSSVAERMGLSDDTVFSPQIQNDMFIFHAKEVMAGKSQAGKRGALRSTWEGLKNASDSELDQMIAEIESGTASFGTSGASDTGFRGSRPSDPNAVAARSGAAAQRAVQPNYIDKASVDLTGGSQVAVQSVSGAQDTPLVDQAVEAQGGSQGSSEGKQAMMQSLDPQVQALIAALVQDGRLTKGEKIKIGDKEIEVA